MDRKRKIVLGIIISITIVLGGFGGYLALNHYLRNQNQDYDDTPPILLFPVDDINTLELLYGFNMTDPENGHNGIDFIINTTVNIIASCNMTVNDKSMMYIDNGGFWQAGISCDVNDAYEIFYAFENFATNETAGQEQLDAITVEIGQEIIAGDIIGQLLYLSSGTHIHYMLHNNGQAVCPYEYFSPSVKNTFDILWTEIGYPGEPCNCTL